MTIHAAVPRAAAAKVAEPSAASEPAASPPRSLQIALVSEGCYPFNPGGVSLWCHQLIKGMPENSFTVVALTVDGTEQSTWPAPDNLTQVVNIPLWGPRPRRRCVPPASFTRHYEALLHSMFQPLTPECDMACADEFIGALRGLYEYAQGGDLTGAVMRNDSLDLLNRAWHEARLDSGRPGAPGPLTLRDAFVATDRIEHMLRSLSHPPVRADLCHMAMNGESMLVGLASKWAYGTPMVLSEHGVYLRERYLSLASEDVPQAVKATAMRFVRRLAVAAYRSADILAPHSSYNRRWQLYGGADPARMRTMYNGVNPADFPVAQGEPEEPTIVFVGRIDPLKDLHTLIRAFAIVRERIPNARLRMFGPVSAANEKYHASCADLITELGLSGAAVLEGPIARQVDAYQAGHLVALTSVSEGFPFTVVESMAMGRPQVCTNVGGISEAVGKDVGFIVPPRDHEAVAEACIRLLEDADLRQSCGVLARKRVLERFTLDQWTNAYRDVYAELVPAVPADAGVLPARDGRPPFQWVFDPDEGIVVAAPYTRIARNLAEAAHSPDPGATVPRQEDDEQTRVVPVIAPTRPLAVVRHDEAAGLAVSGKSLNGASRQAGVPRTEDDEDTCVVLVIAPTRPLAVVRHDEPAGPGSTDGPAEKPLVAP
jgi:glycosyltransferase involved in cell wall biosynthesis